MYVKLFGGPLDGETENVIDGCDGLRLSYPRYAYMADADTPRTDHYYSRSKDDPKYFTYEGPVE